MSGEVEFSVGRPQRRFPIEWGAAPGDPLSEARAGWVRSKVREHAALMAHRTLAAKDGRLLTILRRADLTARRDVDGDSAA